MTRGQELADEAAQATLWANPEDWPEEALKILTDVAVSRPTFTSEDVRQEALLRGLPEPTDPRAWGALFRLLSLRKRIVSVGWSYSHNFQAHNRPIRRWSWVIQ